MLKTNYQEEDYFGQILSYLAVIAFILLCILVFTLSQCQEPKSLQIGKEIDGHAKDSITIKDWSNSENELKKEWLGVVDGY